MRLDIDFGKAVILAGKCEGGDFTPNGTLFLLAGKKYGKACNYIVTAAHVASEVARPDIFLRINTLDGKSRLLQAPQLDWVYDWKNDLAVAIFDLIQVGDDVMWLRDSMLLRDDKQKSKRVDGGTPAYIVGLFNRVPGRERNIPLVHTGHVALVPGQEEIRLENAKAGLKLYAPCYLVQVQTLPGASGSPAFIRRPVKSFPLPHPYEDTGMFPEAFGAPFLLGVCHGSWKGRSAHGAGPKGGKARRTDVVPTSMAIVIPAQRLADILLGEKMRAKHEARPTASERQPAASPALIGQPNAGSDTDKKMRLILREIVKPSIKRRCKN